MQMIGFAAARLRQANCVGEALVACRRWSVFAMVPVRMPFFSRIGATIQ